MSEEQDTKQQQDKNDLLQQLLVTAAEKAAEREAEDALKKGFVTREQINAALATFGEQMETSLVEKIAQALMPKVDEAVKKAAVSDKKSTIETPEDEREADPVAYLLKKGRELGAEAYDDVDKRIIWELTHKGLSQDMKVEE